MDLKGSLVDNKLKIIPSTKLIEFLKTISVTDDTPLNILNFSEDKTQHTHKPKEIDPIVLHLSKTDLEVVAKIKEAVKNRKDTRNGHDEKNSEEIKCNNKPINSVNIVSKNNDENTILSNDEKFKHEDDEKNKFHLTTSDVDWLYLYLEKRRKSGEKVPFLHEILEMVDVELPENKILKRNPVLEARCVKLRAQQEAREYRKMTKSVDNVRMRYPEDSIAYQLKSMNRQLIAIGQFIISIFAGFLFGFKGVEWMIGKLDFGFRLLLGVMCALIIALAEIYFLAKKLNEELNIPETVQLGGPPKFAQETHKMTNENKTIEKVHQD